MESAEGPTDLDLLRAWRDGDNSGGNALFQRYFSTIHRYFANKVGSERDVEDLIQRTFLACMEGRDRFAEQSSFRTWLLGIAHNLLCDHYRKAQRQGPSLDFSEVSVRDLGAGPSTLLGQKRDHQVLLEALRTIPLESQVILELYYWEQFTGPELGEFLGVNENTARSKLRRAKELLLKALRTDPPPSGAVAAEHDLDAWAQDVRAAAFG